MATSQLEHQVRARLSAHDVRYTAGRRRVVAALGRADGPRSAAELYDDLGQSTPLSSLYRSLAVMAEAGVLAPHHSTKGITRYELAEWLSGHHHHLVCVDCGAVDDIELPMELESILEDVVAQVAAVSPFRPSGHSLEIDGRCGACA
jgi:Fe2+ or Zn2+ uptake regulation protein